MIERIIRKAQNPNEREAHRFVHSILYTAAAKKKLMNEIAPRFVERGQQSGYTRVEFLGSRVNDSAEMAMIEINGNPI